MNVTRFTVAGRGRFPVDMLRYDSAWPRDGSDAEALLEEGMRTVQLITADRRGPTIARWASFGWAVAEAFDAYGNPVHL